MITKEDFEAYERVRHCIDKRTDEIFKLLKGIVLSPFEGYEMCYVDSELHFKVGGHYRGEYDYVTYERPIEYLFMTDEEIIAAEEKLEEDKAREEKERMEEAERAERQRDFQMYNELKAKLGL